MWSELRQAARALRHAPGFTVVTAGTLALGIGATAAIFTVVNGVLLAPLPFADADRIVAVTTRWSSGRESVRITGGDFVDVRDGTPAFEAAAHYFGGEVGVQMPGHAGFTPAYWTTSGFFRVFAVAPIAGRVFDDDGTAALVSEEFAARNFQGTAAALGQRLSVEGVTYEIAGVLPASFHFPKPAQVWLPAGRTPANLDRTAFNYQAVGRIREGLSLERARTDLETVGARLAAAYPDSNRDKTFTPLPLRELLVGGIRPTLRLVFGAVLLVLLIACANAASLLLARAAARGQEIAVRVSLGATLGRLLRQFLAESLLLALLGGAGGVALAVAATRALLWLAPQDLPRAESIQVDWTVVAFTLAVSLVTSLIFGIAPALQARRVDPARTLGQGTRAVGGSALHRARTLLLVGEIALAFTLAATAGLLVRSLRALDAVSLGYQADHRLVMYAHAPARTRDEYVRVTRAFDGLLDELARVPGVVSAAAVMGLPGGQYGSNGSYAVEGRDVFGPGHKLPEADFALASGGYFQAMAIPLVRGRDFNRQDQDDAPPVAIVSEALARQGFPGEDPIGRRIVCGLDDPKPMTVVGVVGDVRGRSPAVSPGPLLYMPLPQHPYHANEVQVVLRTTLPPEALVESVRRVGQARNPEMAMRFTTLEQTLLESVATQRFRTALFVAFGALALALGVAGVYGLMSYVVTERHTELGVRMALGARPADVIGLMLGHAARVAAGGLLLGVLAAVAAARLASSLLFEVTPLDPVSFAAAALALLAMALLGAAVPAWRAGRVDPVEAIRE